MANYQKAIQRPDPTTQNHPCLVNANQVAHKLLINDEGTMPTKSKQHILPPIHEGAPTIAYPFSEEEYRKGIEALKIEIMYWSSNKSILAQRPINGYLQWSTYASQETRSPNMETIQDYRHTQVRERPLESEKLLTNLPLMPYVYIIRTNVSKQNIVSS